MVKWYFVTASRRQLAVTKHLPPPGTGLIRDCDVIHLVPSNSVDVAN